MLKSTSSQSNTSLGAIALAALIGGIAGAVVGIKVVQRNERALTHRIKEKAEDVLEHVEEETFHPAEALKQQGAELIDKGKKLAEDLQSFIRESHQDQ